LKGEPKKWVLIRGLKRVLMNEDLKTTRSTEARGTSNFQYKLQEMRNQGMDTRGPRSAKAYGKVRRPSGRKEYERLQKKKNHEGKENNPRWGNARREIGHIAMPDNKERGKDFNKSGGSQEERAVTGSRPGRSKIEKGQVSCIVVQRIKGLKKLGRQGEISSFDGQI